MKTKLILFALVMGASTSFLSAQAPGGQPPAPGGRGGPGPHLLPPGAGEKLKLTDDQKKQITDLEAEVKAKLEKILTPEQAEQLKQMRPPGGKGGSGGQAGPQGSPQGGPGGGKGGPPGGQGKGGSGKPQGGPPGAPPQS